MRTAKTVVCDSESASVESKTLASSTLHSGAIPTMHDLLEPPPVAHIELHVHRHLPMVQEEPERASLKRNREPETPEERGRPPLRPRTSQKVLSSPVPGTPTSGTSSPINKARAMTMNHYRSVAQVLEEHGRSVLPETAAKRSMVDVGVDASAPGVAFMTIGDLEMESVGEMANGNAYELETSHRQPQMRGLNTSTEVEEKHALAIASLTDKIISLEEAVTLEKTLKDVMAQEKEEAVKQQRLTLSASVNHQLNIAALKEVIFQLKQTIDFERTRGNEFETQATALQQKQCDMVRASAEQHQPNHTSLPSIRAAHMGEVVDFKTARKNTLIREKENALQAATEERRAMLDMHQLAVASFTNQIADLEKERDLAMTRSHDCELEVSRLTLEQSSTTFVAKAFSEKIAGLEEELALEKAKNSMLSKKKEEVRSILLRERCVRLEAVTKTMKDHQDTVDSFKNDIASLEGTLALEKTCSRALIKEKDDALAAASGERRLMIEAADNHRLAVVLFNGRIDCLEEGLALEKGRGAALAFEKDEALTDAQRLMDDASEAFDNHQLAIGCLHNKVNLLEKQLSIQTARGDKMKGEKEKLLAEERRLLDAAVAAANEHQVAITSLRERIVCLEDDIAAEKGWNVALDKDKGEALERLASQDTVFSALSQAYSVLGGICNTAAEKHRAGAGLHP